MWLMTLGRSSVDKPDHRHRRLLRVRPKRKRRYRASNNFDEFSSAHVTLRCEVKHDASFQSYQIRAAMSALGQKRTSRYLEGISALPKKRRTGSKLSWNRRAALTTQTGLRRGAEAGEQGDRASS